MKNKKIILNIVFVIAFVIKITAQTPLTVDAGKDTLICLNNVSDLFIGGNPTAKGGNPPYKYIWKCILKPYNTKSDSAFIDPTVANPKFYKYFNGYVLLTVTVIDANNTTVSDSIYIGISIFWCCTLAGCSMKRINDSLELNTCNHSGGIAPFSYKWSPEYGLSNPNIEHPLAKPSIPTTYTLEITDIAGCKIQENGIIITEIKNGNLNSGFVSYKNPISNSGLMNFTSELIGSTLQIVSVSGIVQYQTKVAEESIPLGSLIPTSGIYYYTLTTPAGKVVSGSFVRE